MRLGTGRASTSPLIPCTCASAFQLRLTTAWDRLAASSTILFPTCGQHWAAGVDVQLCTSLWNAECILSSGLSPVSIRLTRTPNPKHLFFRCCFGFVATCDTALCSGALSEQCQSDCCGNSSFLSSWSRILRQLNVPQNYRNHSVTMQRAQWTKAVEGDWLEPSPFECDLINSIHRTN